jgi:hypothetical protein
MAHNFKTTNIKGKEYVEVNERIKYFRTAPEYSGFSLSSSLVHFDDNSCIVKATIKNPDGFVVAVGFAQEDRQSSYINKTSYIENCETSAWGRALANLGIGIDTSIASSNEVAMAIAKQDSAPKQQKQAAPKTEAVKEVVASDLFQRAFDYLMGIENLEERNKMKAAIIKKNGAQFTEQEMKVINTL